MMPASMDFLSLSMGASLLFLYPPQMRLFISKHGSLSISLLEHKEQTLPEVIAQVFILYV